MFQEGKMSSYYRSVLSPFNPERHILPKLRSVAFTLGASPRGLKLYPAFYLAQLSTEASVKSCPHWEDLRKIRWRSAQCERNITVEVVGEIMLRGDHDDYYNCETSSDSTDIE